MDVITPILMLAGLLIFIYGMLMMGAAKGSKRYRHGKFVFVGGGLVFLIFGIIQMLSYREEVRVLKEACVEVGGQVVQEGNDVFCDRGEDARIKID